MSITNLRILENAIGISKGPSSIGIEVHSTDRFIAQNCVGYNVSPTGGTSSTGIFIQALRDLTGAAYLDNNNITLANSTGLSVVGNGIICSSANVNNCVGYATSRSTSNKTYGFIVEGQTKLNSCSSSTGINTNVSPLKIQTIYPGATVGNRIQIENSSFISDAPNRPVDIFTGSTISPSIGTFDLTFKRSTFIQRGATSLSPSPISGGGEGARPIEILDISDCIIEGWNGIDVTNVTTGRFYGNDITVGSNNIYGISSSTAKTFAIASNVIHGGTSTNGSFLNITNQITSTKDSYNNTIFFDQTATVNIFYRTSSTLLPGDTQQIVQIINRRINNSPAVNSFASAGVGPVSYTLAESFTAKIGDVIFYKGDDNYVWNIGFIGPYIGGSGYYSQVVTGTTLNLYLNFSTSRVFGNVIFNAFV